MLHKIRHTSVSIFRKLSHNIKQITLTTPVAIILAAVIISGGLMGYGYITKSTSPVTMFKGKAIDATDFVEGKSKSDVIVVEYSDPECPYCISVYPTLKQLRTEYEEEVAFVYRHFPLVSIHAGAFKESQAIACAGNLAGVTGYYGYMDALYGYKHTNQTSILPLTGIDDIAKNVNLDATAFTECLASQISSDTITKSMADGVTAGVQGTPSTFILKKKGKGYEVVAAIDGARDYNYFKAAIDEAIAR